MKLDSDTELGVGDMHSFWFYAGSWMLRVSLLVAVFKLVGTLSWASLRGYGVSLDFWYGVIPHFDIAVSHDRFVKLVTLSTWLGIVGGALGLMWAAFQSRRIGKLHAAYRDWVDAHYVDQVAEQHGLDERDLADGEAFPVGVPGHGELIRFDRFTEVVSRRGLWLGAWLGALTVLITIAFEMIRHFIGDAYVWQVQHMIATCVALIPVPVLLAMILLGRFREVLAVADVDVLLTAAGIELEPNTDSDSSSDSSSDSDDPPEGESGPAELEPVMPEPLVDTPFAAALGS